MNTAEPTARSRDDRIDDDMMMRRYLVDGYVVAEDLLAANVVAALGDEVAPFARGEYPVVNPEALPAVATDEEAVSRLLAVHFPHWVSPVVRAAVVDPAVTNILQRITGAHLLEWDGSVKCMQSMLFVKGPGLPGQAWHQDERFIPTRDRSLVGVWIALDDATTANGCLEVLPGSHRRGYLHPFRPHGDPDEFDLTDEAYGFDDTGALSVEVRAGSVVFFNGYLLHRSRRNRSAGYRRALVNHYCNAWSLLPWSPLPEPLTTQQIATRDYRTVIPVGPDPYAWKGYDPSPDHVLIRPTEGTWP